MKEQDVKTTKQKNELKKEDLIVIKGGDSIQKTISQDSGCPEYQYIAKCDNLS